MPQVVQICGITLGPLLQHRQFWITAIGWGIGLPLMCARSLDALRFSSVIGNLGAILIVLVTCAFAIGLLPLSHAPIAPASFEPVLRPPYTSISGMGECLSIFVFAFSCAQNLPSLAHELRDAWYPSSRVACMQRLCEAVGALLEDAA